VLKKEEVHRLFENESWLDPYSQSFYQGQDEGARNVRKKKPASIQIGRKKAGRGEERKQL